MFGIVRYLVDKSMKITRLDIEFLVALCLFLVVGIFVYGRPQAQERAAKPLHIWQVQKQVLEQASQWESQRWILVYKFQRGHETPICVAVDATGNSPASLGQVPCPE